MYFLVLILLLGSSTGLGQQVRASARVDSNRILIGDHLRLHVEVQRPENVAIKIHEFADSLENLEIVRREEPVVERTDRAVTESIIYTITSFDSGTHVIPSLVIEYAMAGDTTARFAETHPIPIFVRGIAIDTTAELKDIKPPLAVSISLSEVLPYILGVVGLAGVVWLFFFIRRKRRNGESLLPESPSRPAHEVALDALRSLDSERLWQRGKVKEYHSQLTDIIRTYIERRFGVIAMEMTSDEILDSGAIVELGDPIRDYLKEILVRADLAKFAKFQPLSEENESSLRLGFEFVQRTWSTKMETVVKAVDHEVNV